MQINRFFSRLETWCFDTDLICIERYVDELERALRVSLSRLVVSGYRLRHGYVGIRNKGASRIFNYSLNVIALSLLKNSFKRSGRNNKVVSRRRVVVSSEIDLSYSEDHHTKWAVL